MSTPLINYNLPEDLEAYMSFYGLHFSRKLCDFAADRMWRRDKTTGKKVKITPMDIRELKSILEGNDVEVDESQIYDALYLANMVKADYWGSSIEDEEHMAKYIKDTLCDDDGYEGLVFCRFIGDCNGKGTVIHWDLMM